MSEYYLNKLKQLKKELDKRLRSDKILELDKRLWLDKNLKEIETSIKWMMMFTLFSIISIICLFIMIHF